MADSKLSALTAFTTPAGSDEFYANDGGTSKKITFTNLSAAITDENFTTADHSKLDGIEASADVTDEANVTTALDGATLTAITVATGDKVLLQDADDSDNLKTATAQSIADLGAGAFDADAQTQITPTTAIVLDEATGNEIALDLSYTVNKATSGNDTLIYADKTDSSSPGSSYFLDFYLGGTQKFFVDDDGDVHCNQINVGGPSQTSYYMKKQSFYVELQGADGLRFFHNTNVISTETFKFAPSSGSVKHDASSGEQAYVKIVPTYAQSGTASSVDLLVDRTETSLGSGTHYLMDLRVGGTSYFSVDNTGQVLIDAVGVLGPCTSQKFYLGNNVHSQILKLDTTADILLIPENFQRTWGATTDSANASADTGLARAAAATVQVTDGSTGLGTLDLKNIELDRTTEDAPFINFQATADADATSAISTLTTSGAVTHHIQFAINGTTFWVAGSTTDPS